MTTPTAQFDSSGVNPFLERIRAGARAGLVQCGLALNRQMQRTLSGPSPSAPGSPPGTSDGGLRRSIQTVEVSPLHVRVGSNLFYGLVQETGNWGRPIVPREKKFLLIPLSREARRMYRAVNFNGRAMNLKLIPRKGKPTLLVKDVGRHGGRGWAQKPLFILKKSVRLPKRPWAVPALMLAKPQMSRVFAQTAARVARGGAA